MKNSNSEQGGETKYLMEVLAGSANEVQMYERESRLADRKEPEQEQKKRSEAAIQAQLNSMRVAFGDDLEGYNRVVTDYIGSLTDDNRVIAQRVIEDSGSAKVASEQSVHTDIQTKTKERLDERLQSMTIEERANARGLLRMQQNGEVEKGVQQILSGNEAAVSIRANESEEVKNQNDLNQLLADFQASFVEIETTWSSLLQVSDSSEKPIDQLFYEFRDLINIFISKTDSAYQELENSTDTISQSSPFDAARFETAKMMLFTANTSARIVRDLILPNPDDADTGVDAVFKFTKYGSSNPTIKYGSTVLNYVRKILFNESSN